MRKQVENCRVQQCHFYFVIKKGTNHTKPQYPNPLPFLFPPFLLSCSTKDSQLQQEFLVPHFSCMENQRNPLLNWAYFSQEKSMEELRQSLLCTTLELEQTRIAVQEELRKRDEQILYLKDLLNKTISEREEAQEKCQRLLLQKLLLQHQQQQQQTTPLSGISSIEDEPRKGIDSNNGLSSSDCEESTVSSPVMDSTPQPHLPPLSSSVPQTTTELEPDNLLPEKGKFLQAVMQAGPLLQTLLLAGPLPQWRHPPPPLESFEIPLVTIPSPPPQQLLHHQDSSANTNSLCITSNPIL